MGTPLANLRVAEAKRDKALTRYNSAIRRREAVIGGPLGAADKAVETSARDWRNAGTAVLKAFSHLPPTQAASVRQRWAKQAAETKRRVAAKSGSGRRAAGRGFAR